MKHISRDLRRPPPPRVEFCCRRAQQQTRHRRPRSSTSTWSPCPPAHLRRTRLPCLAQSATSAADSRRAEQPKPLSAQWLAWRAVRNVALAATCGAACLSLACSIQASAPFAAASLTFRSAAQTGSVVALIMLLRMEGTRTPSLLQWQHASSVMARQLRFLVSRAAGSCQECGGLHTLAGADHLAVRRAHLARRLMLACFRSHRP
jgi:hypothetical protein